MKKEKLAILLKSPNKIKVGIFRDIEPKDIESILNNKRNLKIKNVYNRNEKEIIQRIIKFSDEKTSGYRMEEFKSKFGGDLNFGRYGISGKDRDIWEYYNISSVDFPNSFKKFITPKFKDYFSKI